jgi:hypothetical protein
MADLSATVQLMKDIAAYAFADAIDIMQLIVILEASNDPAVVSAINETGVGRVAECISRALWSRLVGVVARAYAPSRDGDLHVQRAFDLLKDQDVRAELEKIGDPVALTDAIERWGRCCDNHRRKSIEDFRDKQIAHWGTLKTPPPIVNDIFAVSRMTATAMTRLANGAGVVTLGLDSQLMGYRGAADRFWRGRGSDEHSGAALPSRRRITPLPQPWRADPIPGGCAARDGAGDLLARQRGRGAAGEGVDSGRGAADHHQCCASSASGGQPSRLGKKKSMRSRRIRCP